VETRMGWETSSNNLNFENFFEGVIILYKSASHWVNMGKKNNVYIYLFIYSSVFTENLSSHHHINNLWCVYHKLGRQITRLSFREWLAWWDNFCGMQNELQFWKKKFGKKAIEPRSFRERAWNGNW
jgi:hypothetical protein